jgi:hypothetical protein
MENTKHLAPAVTREWSVTGCLDQVALPEMSAFARRGRGRSRGAGWLASRETLSGTSGIPARIVQIMANSEVVCSRALGRKAPAWN